MYTLVLSPLFPPDTGAPAPYVKELVTRLGERTSVLLYGYLPEAVPTASFIKIDKRRPLPFRLFTFTVRLIKELKDAERIIINNAPSIELPALIAAFFHTKKMILIESDQLAMKASHHGVYHYIHTWFIKRCDKVVVLPTEDHYRKAEILPFNTFDTTKEHNREQWWQQHLNDLRS